MVPCLIAEEKECTLIFSWISLNAQNAEIQPNKIRNTFQISQVINKPEQSGYCSLYTNMSVSVGEQKRLLSYCSYE